MGPTDERTQAVLAANQSFYDAFTRGDTRAMAELWAESSPVTCFHPGTPLLVGREAILASWRQILREPPPVRMRCDGAVAHVFATTAIVSCYEGGGDAPAHLAATNVFILEQGTWRMVHHQAGPLSVPVPRQPISSSLN